MGAELLEERCRSLGKSELQLHRHARLGRTYWSISAIRAAQPYRLHPAWEYETAPAGEHDEFSAEPILFWGRYSTVTRAYAPHWFYVSIAGIFAALPWILRRFTVRRMLVLTALIAVFCAVVANTG